MNSASKLYEAIKDFSKPTLAECPGFCGVFSPETVANSGRDWWCITDVACGWAWKLRNLQRRINQLAKHDKWWVEL